MLAGLLGAAGSFAQPADGGDAAPDAGAAPARASDAGVALSKNPDGGQTLYDTTGCTSCHAKLYQTKSHHTIGCWECHRPGTAASKCEGAEGKGWKLLKPYPELCLGCHPVQSKTPLHAPITTVGCKVCHDPHGSENKKLLKRWPLDALCYQCHDRKDDKKNVHTAVKNNLCVGCHQPHSGEAAPLLRLPREKLCLRCHDQDALTSDTVRHVPATEGRCLECHDPHTSDNPFQLLAVGKDLCLKCHDSKARPGLDRPGPGKRIDLTKTLIHKPVELGKCQTCHLQMHSGPNFKLLKKRPPDLCYGCHDRMDENKYTHGAVKMGDCPVCHNPHSSDNKTLLREAGPVSKTCFRCHQDDVTGRAYIHVPVRQGNCTACHSPHGSDFPFNLKQGMGKQVCYGCHKVKDEVKVKHKALERYGCTGCHDPHGTANPFQLIKPVNELCQTCHTDKKDGIHATTFVAGGHVVSGDADPRRGGKRFSCASCHNPHGSDNPKLFYFGKDGFEMCDGCHGDRMGAHPELKDIHRRKVVPGWNPDGGESLLPPDAGAPEPKAAPVAEAALPAASPTFASAGAPPATASPPSAGTADAGGGASNDAGAAAEADGGLSFPPPDGGTSYAIDAGRAVTKKDKSKRRAPDAGAPKAAPEPDTPPIPTEVKP